MAAHRVALRFGHYKDVPLKDVSTPALMPSTDAPGPVPPHPAGLARIEATLAREW
jgi:hypothetical protein